MNYTVQEALKPVTVGDALTYWLESYAKENRVDYAALKKRLNNHVIQHIGAMPLDKCELRHWLACFDQWQSERLLLPDSCYRRANRRLSSAGGGAMQSATFLMI